MPLPSRKLEKNRRVRAGQPSRNPLPFWGYTRAGAHASKTVPVRSAREREEHTGPACAEHGGIIPRDRKGSSTSTLRTVRPRKKPGFHPSRPWRASQEEAPETEHRHSANGLRAQGPGGARQSHLHRRAHVSISDEDAVGH